MYTLEESRMLAQLNVEGKPRHPICPLATTRFADGALLFAEQRKREATMMAQFRKMITDRTAEKTQQQQQQQQQNK